MTFCYNFNIIPQSISTESAQLIYRSVAKNKEYFKNVPYAIDFTDFQQTLLRIAIKGQKLFKAVQEHKENKQLNDFEFLDHIQVSRHTLDEYQDIDSVDYHTLEGLFNYLNIPRITNPKDRNIVNNKLKMLRNENK